MTAKRLLVALSRSAWSARLRRGRAGAGRLRPAAGLTQPHGGYSSDTELCEVCHDWHAEIDAGVEPEQVRSSVEQLLTEPSELELATCHDGSGATTNIEAEFGADTRTSFHPVLQPADEIQLACSDCHAQHQSPDEDTKLLYRETSPGAFLFSPPDAPIGDTFCYGCHGSASTLPPPFGDHGAFETSIHATSDRVDPPTPGTDLKCSACHEPHASDYRYLTRANEEELCYTCHATADPNTANGSNPQNAFTAVPNDYATDDGDGIQIFHHPVAQGEQDGGTRTIECASCHNSHLVTRTETASDPARARAIDSGWQFNWDAGSGDFYRSPNAADYCGTCHMAPTTTAPLVGSVDVPYDVNLVNDAGDAADGRPHDRFDLSWFLSGAGSAHGNPAYTPSSYPGCPPGEPCELACTACHDFHGSTNAYMLRENIASPDFGPLAVISATWTRRPRPARDRRTHGGAPHDRGGMDRDGNQHGSERLRRHVDGHRGNRDERLFRARS
jgi:predicted CXXCH cytochrome family protein